jgi:hypothetical protein
MSRSVQSSVALGNAVRLRGLIVCCTALVLLVLPLTAGAQTPSENTSTQSVSSAPPDFMLGRPRAMIGMRGSFFLANANSDFFEFITEQLTLEKSSFRTGTFSGEIAFSVLPQLDIVAGLDLNKVDKNSEHRTMEELLSNGQRVPIQQNTELSEMNALISAKFSLLPRGRRVFRLAWIPRTVVPYIGAGGGYGKYNLRQNGDFVDFVDNHIFSDSFRSEGWAPIVQGFAGTDVLVFKRLMLSLEGRYTWKKADLSQDFIDFEPIDLGGFRFGAGIHFAF